jgi:hypothetical protein
MMRAKAANSALSTAAHRSDFGSAAFTVTLRSGLLDVDALDQRKTAMMMLRAMAVSTAANP